MRGISDRKPDTPMYECSAYGEFCVPRMCATCQCLFYMPFFFLLLLSCSSLSAYRAGQIQRQSNAFRLHKHTHRRNRQSLHTNAPKSVAKRKSVHEKRKKKWKSRTKMNKIHAKMKRKTKKKKKKRMGSIGRWAVCTIRVRGPKSLYVSTQ